MIKQGVLQKIEAAKSSKTLDLRNCRLTALPREIAELTQLTVLDLCGNQLTALPKEIAALTRLTRLNLSGNNFTAFPKALTMLTQLTKLNLRHNQLTDLPKEMAGLTQLLELDLGFNQLRALPKAIAEHGQMIELDLSNNQLTALPKEIAALTQLKKLELRNNQLTALPEEIAALTHLTELYLGFNQFKLFPKAVVALTQLTKLGLGINKFKELPKEIAALTQLMELDLGCNDLTSLPKEIAALTQLRKLYLHGNRLSVLPQEIALLTRLTVLDLFDNRLIALPQAITKLAQLAKLDLRYNRLTALPKEIAVHTALKELNLWNNELQHPPQRVADEGIGAIRRWFAEEALSGTVENYESKVLLLGSPGVGKTSLRKKIEDIDYALNPKESRTVGVEIYPWVFDLKDGEKTEQAVAHLFDFGGQKIQYMAHQFFLSPMAFHILMMNHDNSDSVIAYWLDSIRSINDQPLVLPIYNDFDQQPYPGPCKAFGTLKTLPSLSINLKASNKITLQGDLEKIKTLIGRHILDSKETVLTSWQTIRQALSRKPEPYITIEQYRAICAENKLEDIDSQNDLLVDLNKIGHVLYFKNASSKVFLRPNWLIKALYTLFKPENNLITSDACFKREALMQAWSIPDKDIDRPAYSGDERDMLFNLLLRDQFNICFQLNKREERYLVPQYLPEKARRDVWEQRLKINVEPIERIYYGYSFLPLGFMAHLIVLLHHIIAKTKTGLCIWQQGLVLELDKAVAIVEERETDSYGKHIAIEIAGPPNSQSELRDLIIGDISKLKKLQYDFYDLQPCRPCENCLQMFGKGYRFGLNDDAIQCPECGYQRETKTGRITMNNITITATDGATIIAPLTIGSTIQGSLNIIQESKASDAIKTEIETLLTQIAMVSREIDEKIAKALAEESKSLSEELARKEPREKYLNLSLDGIVEAAKKAGQAAEPILSTAAKLGEFFAKLSVV